MCLGPAQFLKLFKIGFQEKWTRGRSASTAPLRDGMNLQDGAGNRQLNFHQVLCSAKAAGLPKDVCKSFCKAMQDARTGGKDDQ